MAAATWPERITDGLTYLVAPDAGFFGNKVVESILHFWIRWNQQQQLPHTKSDPGDYKKKKENMEKKDLSAAWSHAIVAVFH